MPLPARSPPDPDLPRYYSTEPLPTHQRLLLSTHLLAALSAPYVNEQEISLDVAKDGLESFVICLALGTLRSIRENALDPDCGIWTLGRPVFWEPLQEANLISKEVLSVLQSADELSIAGSLNTSLLDELIARLERRLSDIAEPCWYAKWRAPRKGS